MSGGVALKIKHSPISNGGGPTLAVEIPIQPKQWGPPPRQSHRGPRGQVFVRGWLSRVGGHESRHLPPSRRPLRLNLHHSLHTRRVVPKTGPHPFFRSSDQSPL